MDLVLDNPQRLIYHKTQANKQIEYGPKDKKVDHYTQGFTSDRGRCPRCSRYRRRKWTRRHEFKSWTRLIAFHIALIPLGKV